jgi:GntR family transcriptional repressor for pyruvate dehydrogenase complex
VRCPAAESVSDSLALYLHTSVTRYLQLMELREMLDVEIAGRLAKRIEYEDLGQLRARIARMWQLLDSPQEFAHEDAAFHMDFYRATKNDVLLMIMQPVMDLLEEAMGASFEEPGSAESSLRSHDELVNRIASGDVDGARQVTRQILARGEMRMKHEL